MEKLSEKEKKYFVEVTDATVADPHVAINLKFNNGEGGSLPSTDPLQQSWVWLKVYIEAENKYHHVKLKLGEISDDEANITHSFEDGMYSQDGTSKCRVSFAITAYDGGKTKFHCSAADSSQQTNNFQYIIVTDAEERITQSSIDKAFNPKGQKVSIESASYPGG